VEVWVALIAVLGTLGGAALAPLLTFIGRAGERRRQVLSDRVDAAAAFGVALLNHATHPVGSWDGPTFRKYRDEAYRCRILLAQHLGAGDSRVDVFTSYAVSHLKLHDPVEHRTWLAEHASFRLMEWARGTRPARDLQFFEIQRVADGDSNLHIVDIPRSDE